MPRSEVSKSKDVESGCFFNFYFFCNLSMGTCSERGFILLTFPIISWYQLSQLSPILHLCPLSHHLPPLPNPLSPSECSHPSVWMAQSLWGREGEELIKRCNKRKVFFLNYLMFKMYPEFYLLNLPEHQPWHWNICRRLINCMLSYCTSL